MTESTTRRRFTALEDMTLHNLVAKVGAARWRFIAESMPGRTARQCRDRYQNYLAPKVNNRPWTEKEDIVLLEKYEQLGPAWNEITLFFPGKNQTSVKNRYSVLQWSIEKPVIEIKNEPIKDDKQKVDSLSEIFENDLASWDLGWNDSGNGYNFESVLQMTVNQD